jgi:glycosyltransferase involved in cell wall biosynthesis
VPFEDLPALYARFSLFLAPVWQESFGQVVPFAMSMGLAVAGNDVGALSEVLGRRDVLGRSATETATILCGLLDDPARLEALGKYNSARAQRLFGVERMALRYAGLYRDRAPHDVDLMPGFPAAEHFPI